MAPAEVFWVSKLGNNSVTVEDRYNADGHAAPACVPTPISTQLSGSVASDGSISASWSRPLAVNGTGLVSIVPGVQVNVIAAWAVVDVFKGKSSCEMGWTEHTTHVSAAPSCWWRSSGRAAARPPLICAARLAPHLSLPAQYSGKATF